MSQPEKVCENCLVPKPLFCFRVVDGQPEAWCIECKYPALASDMHHSGRDISDYNIEEWVHG
jgi:hypothetical protein